MKQYDLDAKDSYLLDKDHEMLKELKIQSIPRYVLLDRSGKIVDADAPRPSSESLATKIKELIAL